MRTHYCGEINESLIDQEINLCGWVHRCRNLGGLIFIDLRDRRGIVQVVVDPQKAGEFRIAETLHSEDVVKITGMVRPRPLNMVNSEMLTGKIEVAAHKIHILNKSDVLPFPIAEDTKIGSVNDDLRLKYRYLDLRRESMTKNLLMRHEISKVLRNFLNDNGFIEVETPILTKTTPEGARDYLVPSRVHPGSFYALPQSPQIFKQLLMMSGLDRYYQIVRCFRDEDLRADRQMEFTQIDMETSFLDQDAILYIVEEMLRKLFLEVLNTALPNPFPRLTYDEAMARFGSDKPDLRIPLEIIDIADLVQNVELKIFANAAKDHECRVAALCLPQGSKLSHKEIDDYTKLVGIHGAKGLAHIKIFDLNAQMAGLQSALLKFLNFETIKAVVDRVGARDGDIIFFIADKKEVVNDALGALRLKLGHDHNLIEGGWRPLWVVDFPMFAKTDNGWTFVHHPFTSPVEADPKKLKADPEKILAHAYDMVLNGIELGGGSIRIHDSVIQNAVFEIIGIDVKTAQEQFGHLLTAFKYGCPPHGGIALGLDRLAMLMAGASSIREVIAFPKTQNASCPLTNAPSLASERQLQELGIKVIKK